MKTLSCRCLSVVVGLGLFLLAGPVARATITVDSTSLFGTVTIDPSSGSVSYIGGLLSSAFSQAGANAQYSSLGPSSASSSDVPALGGLATGAGTASVLPFAGSSSATGFIPGATAGFDTSAGRASANGRFQITGASGLVSVTFSTVISGQLTLSSDAYGVFGQGETDYALSVNGDPILFRDEILSIGPDQSVSGPYSTTLTATMNLTAGTTYYLWMEADAEAEVVNSSVAAVPEPAAGAVVAACLALSALVISLVRQRHAFQAVNWRMFMLVGGAMLGLAAPLHATYIGSDGPDICLTCGAQPTRQQIGAISTSLSEGNTRDDYPVVTVQSAYGATLPFVLTYNSYNADGSKAQLDTGLGYGWTHTYNTLLFQQRGQMFRLGADGRVTQYYLNYSGPGGTYTSDTGYFETLTTQPDGSFIVSNKYQSWWHFGSVSNTPFLVAGPVYRLLQMGDRNHNVTTMTYNAGGLLATVTDPFGRTLQFTYNAQNKLSSVTDPLGRTTTFQYDAQARMPVLITDPLGRTIQYTYNLQYQMTRKVDRDGRTYFYMYKSERPFAVTDGNGQPWFSLANPTNWAVNQTNLTFSLRRQYVPGTTTSTDGRGNLWQYSYDTNGYITQTVAPDGATTRYTYDPSTLMLSTLTDANGNVTSYQYDPMGNRIKTTDALGDVTTYTYDPASNMVTSMTDPDGRTTTYQYDGNGNRTQTTDPLGQTQRWTYDSNGNVLSATDQNGRTTTYTYDAFGDRASMTDPLGNVATYQYDGDGNRIQMTDPDGNTTSYQYDGYNRLIKTTDALGHTSTTVYDGVGRTTSMTDQDGHVTTYGYDVRGRLATMTDALGGTTTTTYDADDNRLSLTDANGHTTMYQYDTRNRLIKETDALGGVTSSTYDPVGNRLSRTDADGHTTTYTYDALNRMATTTDALGGVTTYDYSMPGGPPCCSPTPGSSLVTRRQDADGNITYYHYDELNRRVQVVRKNSDTNDVINPTDAVTRYTYDPAGNVITVTDPVSNATTYTFDADNRVISSINAAGDTIVTAYDRDGNPVRVTMPDGNTVSNTYDALNRVVTVTDEIGLVSTTTYDPVGNMTSATDGLGSTTSYAYDALNRQTGLTDPLGLTSTTAYDAVGNMISTTDRDGHTTTYHYDALNRRTDAIDAMSDTTVTAYDPVGNITSVTDADGNTMSYTYDALNRRITEVYPDTPPNTRTNVYDAVGNLISRIDQQGQVTAYSYNPLYFMTNRVYTPSGSNDQFTYDLDGRVITAVRGGWVDTFTYDGANRLTTTVQNGRTLTYTYNIPGRVQTNTQPSGRVLNYTYNARWRPLTLSDTTTNPPIVSYTYDDVNRVITRTNRNGTTTTYTYNANDWITSLEHSNSAGLIAGFTYAYDNEGKKLDEKKLDNLGDSEAYAYDKANRLTNYDVGILSGVMVPSPVTAKAYNLDPVGNWKSVVSNLVTETRTYNAANELTGINGGVLTYDHNGNLTNNTNYAYFYDEENRLTQVQRLSDSAIVGRYIYDALGRRVETIADASGSPTTNYYYYDNQQIIEEQNGVATTATYTYGRYIDDVLTMDRGGQTYYYHANSMCSVHALSDSTGNVVERYAYDVYGRVSVLGAIYSPAPLNAWGTPHSAVGNAFLFTGREFDEESGLYYFRARAYDSYEGRFIQRDPLGPVDSENLYVAVFVPNHVDPSGRQRVLSCTSGGETRCGVVGPSCRCLNPANNGPWRLDPGTVDPTHTVATTRTFVVERPDGERFRVTCNRLDDWQRRSRAHEQQHEENCQTQNRTLNGTYARDYNTQALCIAARNDWVREWNVMDAADAAHTAVNSPRPTNCQDEYTETVRANINGQPACGEHVRIAR